MKKSRIITSALSLLLISFINLEVHALNMPSINLTSIITFDSEKSLEEIICNLQYNNFNSDEMNLESNMLLEENLELEDWMLEPKWSEEFEFINESELELEQWMLEGEWMETENDFTESELQLETWMQSPASWNFQENL
jgi:hypothetical protein